MRRPCTVCVSKGFECTYDNARKKRGPAGKRIQEIRRAQRKSLDSTEQPNDLATKYFPDGSDLTRALTADTDISAISGNAENDLTTAGPYWQQSAAGQPLATGQSHATSPQSMLSHAVYDPDLLGSSAVDDFVFPSLPIDSPSSSWDPFGSLLQQDLPPLSTTIIDVWPAHINEETLLPWIDVYFKRLHPTIPILDRAEMYREMLVRKHHTDSQYGAMLLALCAFAMTQPVQIHERADTPSRSMQARMLMEESVKMRVAADFGEHPSIQMILASFFLFACLFGNEQHRAARHKLREAVDLAHALGIHMPGSYDPLATEERQRWLRTYLVLSVTERAYALQQGHSIGFRGRPAVSARFMQDFDPGAATDYISRLMYAEQSDANAVTGLMYLMETFDAIDEQVVECWSGYCRYSDGACELFDRRKALQMYRAQQAAREACISGNVSFAPGVSPAKLGNLLESQQADISVTQFWLLNRLWKLCLSHGLLRNSSDRQELQYDFACQIAKATLLTCNSFSVAAMEVHGIGFAEKLYDVASGVITATQASPHSVTLEMHINATDDDIITVDSSLHPALTVQNLLQGFRELMNTFRGGEHPYKTRFELSLAALPLPAG